jgi:hypothetical protein
MSAKEVKFSVDARDRMLHGIDTLAHAVRVTLGPPGPGLTRFTGADHGRDGHERRGDDRGAHRGRERSCQAGPPRQLSVEDITGEAARGSSRSRHQAAP